MFTKQLYLHLGTNQTAYSSTYDTSKRINKYLNTPVTHECCISYFNSYIPFCLEFVKYNLYYVFIFSNLSDILKLSISHYVDISHLRLNTVCWGCSKYIFWFPVFKLKLYNYKLLKLQLWWNLKSAGNYLFFRTFFLFFLYGYVALFLIIVLFQLRITYPAPAEYCLLLLDQVWLGTLVKMTCVE